ncbi:MAG: S1 RNA-binding domain-containing protein [Patescibacteria group bacterium]|nr:S1 RNA-binding domain-containing protein [Patescibacteria group bacterium]
MSTKIKADSSKDVMAELLSKHSPFVKTFKAGDKIKGKVLRIEHDRVVLDIGAKSEGIVAEKAFKESSDFVKTLKVGDEVEARVLIPETNEGFTILSFRSASYDATWANIEDSFQKGEELQVVVKTVMPSGLIVDILGLTGFIPTSQIGKELSKDIQQLQGKTLTVRIFDLDYEKRKIILSEKEVSEKEELSKIREAMQQIEIGDVYEGQVVNISDFGCFVQIPVILEKGKDREEVKVEGLVHISQLSWEKVVNPSDFVSIGQTLKVTVIEKRDGRIALSAKQTQDDPWLQVVDKYPKDKKFVGIVTRVSEYGVFVQLERGVEGLVHITKIPPGQKYEVGNEVNVYIENVDVSTRKISLGIVLTSKPLGYK